MAEERVQCNSCGTSYNKMFLMGKQGNVNTCPMCGATIVSEEEHSNWITWYYYKDPKYGDYSLWDKQPLRPEELELIKEFKAPPRDPMGSSEQAKEILRTYIPDAFENKQAPEDVVRCPYCHSKDIQLVPKRYSLLTGFATNRFDRMCVKCKKKF